MKFFRRLLRPIPASIIAMAMVSAAWAAFVPQITTPVPAADVQAFLNQVINSINSTFGFNDRAACSGTTTATCTGTRVTVSITGLTTAAAGVSSAAMVVTDTSVAANSTVFCQVQGYAGTGNPIDSLIIPAAGSFSFVITNVANTGALNATVVSTCTVLN